MVSGLKPENRNQATGSITGAPLGAAVQSDGGRW